MSEIFLYSALEGRQVHPNQWCFHKTKWLLFQSQIEKLMVLAKHFFFFFLLKVTRKLFCMLGTLLWKSFSMEHFNKALFFHVEKFCQKFSDHLLKKFSWIFSNHLALICTSFWHASLSEVCLLSSGQQRFCVEILLSRLIWYCLKLLPLFSFYLSLSSLSLRKSPQGDLSISIHGNLLITSSVFVSNSTEIG